MTSRKHIVDLVNLDYSFDHIVFNPEERHQCDYVFKTVKFKAILSFVL